MKTTTSTSAVKGMRAIIPEASARSPVAAAVLPTAHQASPLAAAIVAPTVPYVPSYGKQTGIPEASATSTRATSPMLQAIAAPSRYSATAQGGGGGGSPAITPSGGAEPVPAGGGSPILPQPYAPVSPPPDASGAGMWSPSPDAPVAPDPGMMATAAPAPASPAAVCAAVCSAVPPPVAAASPLAIAPAPAISTPTVAITPPAATATVSPSLWTRILNFFGLGKKATPAPALPAATIHGETMTDQKQGAISLVRRARAGDQNAMGTLDMIGKNARAGNARAKVSFAHAMAYIKENPHHEPKIHGDGGAVENYDRYDPPADALFASAVQISHGPLLTGETVASFASQFGAEEEVHAFAEGMRGAAPVQTGNPRLDHASTMGAAMSVARRIQQARQPGANLAHYDKRIAAEIG